MKIRCSSVVRLAVTGSLLLGSSHAFADSEVGFAVNNAPRAETGSEWFVADSVDIAKSYAISVGVVGDWAHRPLVLTKPDGSEIRTLVDDVWVSHVGVSIVPLDRLRLSASLPIQMDASGTSGATGTQTVDAPARGPALGDLRVAADVRVFGAPRERLRLAAGAAAWVPTGEASTYATDSFARVEPRALVAGDVGRFAYAARVGVLFRRVGDPGDRSVGAELTAGASFGAHLLDRRLLAGPELSAVRGVAGRGTPVEALFGAHYTMASGIRVGAGVGGSVVSAVGSPDVRALLSFEWIPGARASPPNTVAPESEPLDAKPTPMADTATAEQSAPRRF